MLVSPHHYILVLILSTAIVRDQDEATAASTGRQRRRQLILEGRDHFIRSSQTFTLVPHITMMIASWAPRAVDIENEHSQLINESGFLQWQVRHVERPLEVVGHGGPCLHGIGIRLHGNLLVVAHHSITKRGDSSMALQRVLQLNDVLQVIPGFRIVQVFFQYSACLTLVRLSPPETNVAELFREMCEERFLLHGKLHDRLIAWRSRLLSGLICPPLREFMSKKPII